MSGECRAWQTTQMKLNRTQILGALLLAGIVLLILLLRYWMLPR